MSKVPLDSACGCLPASATGLAAGEAVGEEGEEGDDTLLFALVVCVVWCWRAVCLTLIMALQIVTMPFTMARKQLVMAETTELNWSMLAIWPCRSHSRHVTYARCDSAHCCGVVWFLLGWCYWLSGTEAVACFGLMLVGGEWRKRRKKQRLQKGSIKRFSSWLHQGMQPRCDTRR